MPSTEMSGFIFIEKTTWPLQEIRDRGHDRNVVGFTTTYAISVYHH